MNKGHIVIRSYLFGAVFLLLLWWGIALLLDLPVIPAPDKVLLKLVRIFSQSVAVHAGFSLWRIAAGLLLAVLIGYPVGVIMGYFPRADRFLAPLVYLTYPIPKIALLPILMLLAGVGEFSKILMIFLIIVFQVVIAVRDAIRTIPVETYYPLYSLGASVRQIFCEVIFLPPCRNSSRLFVLPWQRLFPSCFLPKRLARNMAWGITLWMPGCASIIWICMQGLSYSV